MKKEELLRKSQKNVIIDILWTSILYLSVAGMIYLQIALMDKKSDWPYRFIAGFVTGMLLTFSIFATKTMLHGIQLHKKLAKIDPDVLKMIIIAAGLFFISWKEKPCKYRYGRWKKVSAVEYKQAIYCRVHKVKSFRYQTKQP